MSTKTTFKRIALVAVAALGLGVLSSVAPASATAVSMTLDNSSITVVSTSATDSPVAVFGITVTNTETGTGAGLSAGESITASVVSGPATEKDGTAYLLSELQRDIKFREVRQSQATGIAPLYDAAINDGGAAAGDGVIVGGVNTGHYAMAAGSAAAVATASAAGLIAKTRTYYIAVTVDSTTAGGLGRDRVLDSGVYNIQFDLQLAGGATIQRLTAKVDFVSAASNSGAKLTAASTGQWFVGETPSVANQTSTKKITTTLRNRDDGALRTGTGGTPVVSALVASADTVINYQTFNEVADTLSETVTAGQGGDGVYAVGSTAAFTGTTGPLTLTTRYGLASATASITLNASATAGTTGTSSFTATGGVLTTNNVALPLTTTSVTFNHTVTTGSGDTLAAVTAYDVYYTLSYGASCLVADQAPLATTSPVKLTTDSAGKVSVTVTSLKPKDLCSATVTWSGASTPGAAQTATWQAPVATRSVVSTGSYQALTKSTHTITWTVTDQFGNPNVAEVVTFTASGANIPTAGLASSLTDANGQVKFTWTDAAGVPDSTTLGSTSLRLNTVGGVTPATNAAAVVVTYKAALDIVASIRATYTDGANQVLVPTTNIGGVAGISVATADQIDTTRVVSGAATAPWVELTFTARNSALTAVTGVPTTITVTGAQLIGSDGKLANSIVVFANNAVRILGTKVGVATVTATNGTLTSTATINFVNAATDARVLSLKESAGLVTATVVDAFGNGVAGIVVSASSSGGAWFGNGATSNTFTTAVDGTVTFAMTGAGTVSASIATTNAKTAFLANSGNATGTVVTPGAPAGVRVASIATLGRTDAATAAATAAAAQAAADKATTDAAIAALKAQLDAAAAKAAADKATSDAAIAAAQAAAVAASKAAQDAAVEAATAAADAAAEATDAANAATDAANASAEAGDAATAAAQDAADAVAALSTQVSEMIDTLKKQITALTNLVIKIQKKVKA
jgi:hypothetical protein